MTETKLPTRAQAFTLGQSLVETALFLPIILFLLAGVLELSNLLITQNRVSTAARIGTGFGATNYNADGNVRDTFQAMTDVARNNVTETLDLQEDRWDIYTVKATLDSITFTEWITGHRYGIGQVYPTSEWAANQTQIKEEIRTALLGDDSPGDDDLEIVATVAYHDRDSFLGLGFFDPGLTRIRGLTVMRVSNKSGTYLGCDTFPIALSVENFSVWPYDPDDPMGEMLPEDNEMYRFVPDSPPGTYTGGAYWWPEHENEPPPYYTTTDMSEFPANLPGIHITEAKPGYLFLVKQASKENDGIGGAFGWLRWEKDSPANNQGTLADSLEWPGNSTTYDYPDWSNDGIINKYDLVKTSTGTVNSIEVRTWMREHVEEGLDGRQLRLIVFTPPIAKYNYGDANNDGYGTQLEASGGQAVDYEVYAFVRVRIVAWKLTGQDNWLLMEYLGWDEECVVASSATP